ncbi:hypothetical protein M5K25_027474 [Dendrobium thyrsiflorum]|uniref:Uncharacterized protein n=1 Tax=Dendrobium thyrsiflorum TaxID=117978 RepID=A0ABD0TTW9_DENTH
MDNDDPQRQLLLLIRDYSAEKTKGERTLSDLKKRLLELQADYEAASAKLEQTKRVREAAERELRGSQAQLDLTNASLLAMETRNSGLQDEIFQVSSKLLAIKNDEKIQRDEFIRVMHEFNSKLRNFNEMAFQALKKGHPNITSDTDQMMDMQSDDTLKDLENEILSMDAEMLSLKGECQKMTNDVSTFPASGASEEVHMSQVPVE